jgi:hypothetical protein
VTRVRQGTVLLLLLSQIGITRVAVRAAGRSGGALQPGGGAAAGRHVSSDLRLDAKAAGRWFAWCEIPMIRLQS